MNNLPIISEEQFSKAIDSLRIQLAEDKKNSELVAEAFGATEFALYDNHKLINTVIDLLSIWFDKSELEHFCFVLNFGKLANDEDFESTAELYERLTRGL